MAGVPINGIKEYAGHASIVETQKYLKFMPQSINLTASVPLDWPLSLMWIIAPITATKRKALEKPDWHPKPKLCDSVVTGLADSIS
jgi:hypothetical protein